MRITATLSAAFVSGQNNIPFAVDGQNLTQEELRCIKKFEDDLYNDVPLLGKNKPSWVNDNYEKIPGSDNYKDANYWHYHCGPTWRVGTYKGHTVDLAFNPGGMRSNECIHYAKTSDDTITIVGYSRLHIPFPPSDYGDNPLFEVDLPD